MHTFDFTYQWKANGCVLAEIECTYVSNGPMEDPTIRVFNVATEGRSQSRSEFESYNPRTGVWTVWRDVDFDRGDEMYETLLAAAELHGSECVEADAGWAVSRREYDRDMARAAE